MDATLNSTEDSSCRCCCKTISSDQQHSLFEYTDEMELYKMITTITSVLIFRNDGETLISSVSWTIPNHFLQLPSNSSRILTENLLRMQSKRYHGLQIPTNVHQHRRKRSIQPETLDNEQRTRLFPLHRRIRHGSV
jgi:hypothetical protein